jgi:hypothetical protein
MTCAKRPIFLAGSNLPASSLSPAERLDEVAEILAAGLQRLLARQSSRLSADRRESSLDCTGEQSGHPNALKGDLGSDR